MLRPYCVTLLRSQIVWTRGKLPTDAPPPADRMSRQDAHTRGYLTVSQRRAQLIDDDGRSHPSGAPNMGAIREAAHLAQVLSKKLPAKLSVGSFERARDHTKSLGELTAELVMQCAAVNDFDIFAKLTRSGRKRLAMLLDTYAPRALLSTFIDASRFVSAAERSVTSPLDKAKFRVSLVKRILQCAHPLLVDADFAKSKPPHVAGVYAVFALPAAANCVEEATRVFDLGEGISLATGEPLELGYRIAVDGLLADARAFVDSGNKTELVALAYVGQENRGETCAKGKRLDRVRDHFGRTGEANLREFCFRRSRDAESYVVTPIGPVHTASRWLCFLPPRTDDVDMLECAFIVLFVFFGIAIANNTPGSGRVRRFLHSTWGGGPLLGDRLIELQGTVSTDVLRDRNFDADVSFFLSRPLRVAALMMASGLCWRRQDDGTPEIIRPQADRATYSQFQCVEALLSLFATGLGGQERTIVLWANSCTCGKRGRCACIMYARKMHLRRFDPTRISWHDSHLSLYLGPRGRGVAPEALISPPSTAARPTEEVRELESRVDVEQRMSARLAALGVIMPSLSAASLGIVDSALGRVFNRVVADLARADAGGSVSWSSSHVGSRLTSGTDVRRAFASRARLVDVPSDPRLFLSAVLERQRVPVAFEETLPGASTLVSGSEHASRVELARVIDSGYVAARSVAAAAVERHISSSATRLTGPGALAIFRPLLLIANCVDSLTCAFPQCSP